MHIKSLFEQNLENLILYQQTHWNANFLSQESPIGIPIFCLKTNSLKLYIYMHIYVYMYTISMKDEYLINSDVCIQDFYS